MNISEHTAPSTPAITAIIDGWITELKGRRATFIDIRLREAFNQAAAAEGLAVCGGVYFESGALCVYLNN